MSDESAYHSVFTTTSRYVLLRNFFTFVTLVSSVLLVRSLGPGEYGKWAINWQIISLVAPILSLGLLTTLAKFLPEIPDPAKKSELLNRSLATVGAVLLVGCALTAALWPFFWKQIPSEVREFKWVLGAFIVVTCGLNLFEGYYRGLGRFNLWTVFDGVRSNAASLLAVAAVYFWGAHYGWVYASYFSCAALFLFLAVWRTRGDLRWAGFGIPKTAAHFTLVQFSGQILFLLCMSTDPVLLRSLLKDAAQVGLYDVGIRIPRTLEGFLLSPLSVPFLYYFSHTKTQLDHQKIMRFGTRILGLSMGTVGLGLFSAADKMVPLLFGHAYASSATVLKIYGFVPFFVSCTTLVGAYLIAENKPLWPTVIYVVGYGTLFCLDLLLIPHFRAAGAAASSLFMVSFNVLGVLFYLSRQGVELRGLLGRLVLGLVLAVLSGIFVSMILPLPVFALYSGLTRLVTRDDFRRLWKMAKAARRKAPEVAA